MSDDTSGNAAPSTAASPDAAPAASAPVAAPAAAPASVLGSGAAAAPTPQAPADPHAWLPEKLRVFGEDGKTLNLEDSAKKMGEAYTHLEKRFGSGDMPPKTVEDYKVTVPEALADKLKAEDLAGNEAFKAFLAKAHGVGLTQKQLDTVVGEFLDRSIKNAAAGDQLSAEAATAELRQGWKTDAEFQAGVQAAYRAGKAYGGADFEGILKDHGNDPRIVRLLAAVGKELGEDRGTPAAAGAMAEPDVESLAKSAAYWNPNDPQHAVVKAKVAAHYAALHGTAAKRTGSMSFQSSV
jgi:hypothetical protein